MPEGVKADSAKLRMDLIPPDVQVDIARVYTYGALKYEDRNWEKGMNWSRLIAAVDRHFLQFKLGETYDTESGLPHLAHAIVGLQMLHAHFIRGIGQDDLPTPNGYWQYMAGYLNGERIKLFNKPENKMTDFPRTGDGE